MSGGVDSSFVAMQLKAQGHTVAGATLLMHEHTELARARAAAQQLDVPL
jgi:tRNA U34 2-thiouridine synthase MnmA/TrmU